MSHSMGLAGQFAPPMFAAFFLFLLLAVLKQFQILPRLGATQWIDAALLLTAVATVVFSNARVLPFQNVFWGALVIATLGGLAHGIGVLAGIPFGNFTYTAAAGPRIAGVLPWSVPLMWVVVIYSSRGMARLISNRWRGSSHYGFWMIGITIALALILDLGLDPIASAGRRYWVWEMTRLPLNWQGTPLTNFAGWLLTAGIIVLFVTPMLINKKPTEAPVERLSAWVWILLNGYFLFAGWSHKQWSLVITTSLFAAAAVVFASTQLWPRLGSRVLPAYNGQ